MRLRKTAVCLGELADDPAALLAAVCDRHRIWKKAHVRWTQVHYILNALALLLTLLIAAFPGVFGEHPNWSSGISLTAAMVVGFLAYSTPAKQARSYVAAWRLLDELMFKYAEDPTPETLKKLVAGVDQGERILAGKDPY